MLGKINMLNVITYIREAYDISDMDFNSERGRNKIAKSFEKQIYNIAHKYFSDFDTSDMFSVGEEGLAYALTKIKKNMPLKQKVKYINSYIYYYMLQYVQGTSKEIGSHDLVHTSKTNKKRHQYNYSIDHLYIGDNVGYDEFNGHKALIDLYADAEAEVDEYENLKKLKQIEDTIKKEFSKKDFNLYALTYGVFGKKKTKQRDIAKKYGIKPTTLCMRLKKMNEYLQKNIKL